MIGVHPHNNLISYNCGATSVGSGEKKKKGFVTRSCPTSRTSAWEARVSAATRIDKKGEERKAAIISIGSKMPMPYHLLTLFHP